MLYQFVPLKIMFACSEVSLRLVEIALTVKHIVNLAETDIVVIVVYQQMTEQRQQQLIVTVHT